MTAPARSDAARKRQRGATLAGYGLTVAAMTALSLAGIAALERGASEYLGTMAASVGTARDPIPDLAGTIVDSPSASQSGGGRRGPVASGSNRTYRSGPKGQLSRTGKKSARFCLSAGSPVRQQPCDESSGMEFQALRDIETNRLRLTLGGDCLTVDGTKKGSAVRTAACTTGDPTQEWTVDNKGRIRNHHSGKCLDVRGKVHKKAGGDLQQWKCNNRDRQRWSLPLPRER